MAMNSKPERAKNTLLSGRFTIWKIQKNETAELIFIQIEQKHA